MATDSLSRLVLPMKDLLIAAIAVFALLIAVRYGLTFNQLRKLVFQYPQFAIQPQTAVPAAWVTVFQPAIAQLQSDGFAVSAYLTVQSIIQVELESLMYDWSVLLYRPDLKTFATIGLRRSPESSHPVDISFYTYFSDGTLLLTMNGNSYGLLGEVPNTIIEDPCTPDPAIQWQAHQTRLQYVSAARVPVEFTPAEFLQAQTAQLHAYLDGCVKAGTLAPLPQDPQRFRLRLPAILRMLPAFIRGVDRETAIAQQRRKQAAKHPDQQVAIPVELEVRQFQWLEQIQRRTGKSKQHLWLMLGSFIIFVATFTPYFPPRLLALFVGALLLHEGGHIAAMKFFGYRDTSMLFLPFLGALAIARKDDATLTQKFWVALAGPLPGLLLGIGLARVAWMTDSQWLIEASGILIFLNVFNLLPVYPLDGGQIVELLVLSRMPWLGAVFKGVGVLLLGLLGLESPVMFVFAGFIALTIPATLRSDRLRTKLHIASKKSPPNPTTAEPDPTERLGLIFAHLQQTGQGHLPFAKKYALVKSVWQRQSEASAHWTTRMALSGLYGVSLIGGGLLGFEALIPNGTTYVLRSLESPAAMARREIRETSAAIAANPKNFDAFLRRSRMHVILKEYDLALADANELIQLRPDDPSAYRRRSWIRSRMGDRPGAEQDETTADTLSQTQQLRTYTQKIQANPRDPAAYAARAHVHHVRKDYANALADYNRALSLSATDATIYLHRAALHQQMQNYPSAIADLNRAIALDPNEPLTYYQRSDVRRQAGDLKGAIADEQQYKQLSKIPQ